jgi:superfamily II DNA/RNA helicase
VETSSATPVSPAPGSSSPSNPDTSFSALGVADDLIAVLADVGVIEAFPVQSLTMADALAGRDVCGKAPTGSGKTLAFGIPIIERTVRGAPNAPSALVLAPTRELARQIGDELAPVASARGLVVHVLQGGAPFEPQIAALQAGVDIAIATPGRLLDLVGQGLVSLGAVRIAVVDEADRMADLGFLPQVRELLDLVPDDRQTMLFSATLDGDVDVLVHEYQRDPVVHEVAQPELAPIRHLWWFVHDAARPALLAKLVKRSGATVVFSKTRHGADRIAKRLSQAQVRTAVLHGGNSQLKRQAALDEFKRGDVQALVATDVAARGIHVDDVACVVQYDLPADPKDYVHRAGRTGRAGAVGTVVSFVSPFNEAHARHLIAEAGVDAELGEPDLSQIEPAAIREAIDDQLAELALLRRPGAIGSVDLRPTHR